MESIQGGLDSSGRTGGTAPDRGDSDAYARATANILSEPQVGQNRSNVRGMANYDPAFAAAFDISRGLDPTNNFGGTGGLAVPSYLRPQIEGRYGPIAPKYFSPVERFMQEDLSDIAQSGPGLISLVGRGLDSLFGGIDFLNNSKAGDTVDNIVADQKRIEIADLEQQRQNQLTDPSFMSRPIDTVTKTSLDKLKEPLSGPPEFNEFSRVPVRTITRDGLGLEQVTGGLDYPGFENDRDTNALVVAGTNLSPSQFRNANVPPTPVMVNQIQRDIAKSRGIFDLPEAKPFSEIINNTEIDAGENKGQNLYDGSQYNDLAMQKLKNLGYNVEVPNLPNAFNSPTKRPFPGTDEVALRRGVDGYTFANTFNRPLDASREGDPSGSNLTTDQLRAAEFSGFSFDPVTNKSIYDERGPIEFIKKTNFPLDQQGIISLNTDMDYGQTNSLDNLLRNTPRSVAERNFLLNEIRKEKERMDNAPRRYPDSGTAGLPGLY